MRSSNPNQPSPCPSPARRAHDSCPMPRRNHPTASVALPRHSGHARAFHSAPTKPRCTRAPARCRPCPRPCHVGRLRRPRAPRPPAAGRARDDDQIHPGPLAAATVQQPGSSRPHRGPSDNPRCIHTGSHAQDEAQPLVSRWIKRPSRGIRRHQEAGAQVDIDVDSGCDAVLPHRVSAAATRPG